MSMTKRGIVGEILQAQEEARDEAIEIPLKEYDVLSELADIVIGHSYSSGVGEGSDHVGIKNWKECRKDMAVELIEWYAKNVVTKR